MANLNLKDNAGFLLKNQTVDTANPDAYFSDGAKKSIVIWGTFGGGTVTLQMSPDYGATWIDLERSGGVVAAYTTNKVQELNIFPTGILIRAILSGSTTPSINARLF